MLAYRAYKVFREGVALIHVAAHAADPFLHVICLLKNDDPASAAGTGGVLSCMAETDGVLLFKDDMQCAAWSLFNMSIIAEYAKLSITLS